MTEVWPLRAIVEAILYVDRSGCAWRYLPSDFPPWLTDAGFHINAAQVHIRWIFRQDYWDPLSRRTLPMPGPDCWARTMAG